MVADIFALVTPGADEASGPTHVVLRWFHALVWVLLGLSALARAYLPDSTLLAAICNGRRWERIARTTSRR